MSTSTQDFKGMLETMLKQKPELNAEDIRGLIDEKKRKVGAGYLTDQGALFLVAADLGVSFDNVQKIQAGLKDIYVGAKEVTVVGRIMNLYPVHTFTKRDSNEQSSTRTIVVYDKDARVKVKLWDKQVVVPDEMGLQVGDVIKIIKGYVRAGLDGKPVINLGSYSAIETTDDPSIPNIDSMTTTVDSVTGPQDIAVITGTVSGNPRVNQFVNAKGELSRSLQMQISNEAGTRNLRAVIWNVEETRLPKVFKSGVQVRMIGVKIKQGNPQYGNGDFEIHGDEGTVLQFSENQEELEVMPFRIISVGEETGRGSFLCLTTDRGGKTFVVTVDNSLASSDQLASGSMIECVPSRIFGNSIVLSKDESYIRVTDEDSSFPNLTKFEKKVKDIQISPNPCIVEAIVLQAPETADVNTKSGETVPVTSTLLGDDTGEIRLVGWRNQSAGVNKLNVGDRVRLVGVTAGNGREGKPELTLRPYSSVTRLS